METETMCVWTRGSWWCPPRARLRPREFAGPERRAPGGGILLATLRSSICFGIKGERWSGRCARTWGVGRCRNQASGYLVVVGIEFARWQQCGSPARDFASLAALFVEGAEGKWRGGWGDYISAEGSLIKQEVKRIKEEKLQRRNGRRREIRSEEEDADVA
jgi:hypothetical protein